MRYLKNSKSTKKHTKTNKRIYMSCAFGWLLVVLGFNATLTAKVISWRSMTHMCFLAFSHLTQPFFPKPPTTFLTCFCKGERRKYAGKKSRLDRDRTHNHQVMSLTRSPLSHQGGAMCFW